MLLESCVFLAIIQTLKVEVWKGGLYFEIPLVLLKK